jgi:pimeloyl-ACP methyl ester carboxylesterase
VESVPGPRVEREGGVEIATYLHGGDGPPVLLVHATGFHGRCWTPLAESLTGEFSVWSVDQRGHGASGKSPGGRYDWSLFVADLLAVVDTIGGGPWRGGGHSMGGAILLMAEAKQPGTFASLCCYEPVVIPPVGPGRDPFQGVPLAELARKRRPGFPSRQAALENFRAKPPFDRFDAQALEAYVEYGLIDQPDGSVTLACAREDEASVFEDALSSGAWDALPRVRAPVAVLGGNDPSDPVGTLIDTVARRLPRGGARRFEDLDHFGPFERPQFVGAVMAEALGGRRSTSGVTASG